MRHRLRIGILDVLTTPARSWGEVVYDLVFTKQYGAIMPQAIAVWARQLGHTTFYATYHGVGDPRRALPDDLDVLFVSTYTQASPLAYALAKLFSGTKTLRVIGGPHAKAFPRDCLRFFDVVVGDCDRQLIVDILDGHVDPGASVASRPVTELPLVEERLPELRTATFACGRWPFFATTVPLLASAGCPYACDFCVDWNAAYRILPLDRLAADLHTIAARLPGAMYAFQDPNFAVRFDDILGTIEALPPPRNRYVMETSLSVLRGDRPRRLGASNCVMVAPGVESWDAYGAKAGVGHATGASKVAQLVQHFSELHVHVPYLQANFMLELDAASGDQSVALTKEFMTRTPFVWPVVNIPHPFGGTPFFTRVRREGRLLETMPFGFYYSPYLVARPKHEDALTYYEKLIELFAHFTSPSILARRLAGAHNPFLRLVHATRTHVKRTRLRAFRRLCDLLRSEPSFRAFHAGETSVLPAFYRHEYDRMLGRFATLMSDADRVPVFDSR